MLMKTDELGIPRFSNRDLVDMIYSGHIDKCHVVPVSYTHLRAHETLRYLVCRLLLEKKK